MVLWFIYPNEQVLVHPPPLLPPRRRHARAGPYFYIAHFYTRHIPSPKKQPAKLSHSTPNTHTDTRHSPLPPLRLRGNWAGGEPARSLLRAATGAGAAHGAERVSGPQRGRGAVRWVDGVHCIVELMGGNHFMYTFLHHVQTHNHKTGPPSAVVYSRLSLAPPS